MLTEAVEVAVPSSACKVKLALVAVQSATMSAVTSPSGFTAMLDSVTPFDGFALMSVTAMTVSLLVKHRGDARIRNR